MHSTSNVHRSCPITATGTSYNTSLLTALYSQRVHDLRVILKILGEVGSLLILLSYQVKIVKVVMQFCSRSFATVQVFFRIVYGQTPSKQFGRGIFDELRPEKKTSAQSHSATVQEIFLKH